MMPNLSSSSPIPAGSCGGNKPDGGRWTYLSGKAALCDTRKGKEEMKEEKRFKKCTFLKNGKLGKCFYVVFCDIHNTVQKSRATTRLPILISRSHPLNSSSSGFLKKLSKVSLNTVCFLNYFNSNAST